MAGSRRHACPLLCDVGFRGKLTPLLKVSSSRAGTGENHDATEFLAEQTPSMPPRGGRPLERFCRRLNENVTTAVLMKCRAEYSVNQWVKRAPTVMRIQSSPISDWRVLGSLASDQCCSVVREGWRHQSFAAAIVWKFSAITCAAPMSCDASSRCMVRDRRLSSS